MNIDKKNLKLGMWYEDKDNNRVEVPEHLVVTSKVAKALGIDHYKTCYPLEITEELHIYYDKENCKHPLKYRERTGGWVDGIKGCRCKKCGMEKVGKKTIPFLFMKWENGADTQKALTFHTLIGGGKQELIMAMVNSGDFTLKEALCVLANSCERCMNVLAYKYLDGEDGYPEFSPEWEKAGTSCEFCKPKEEETLIHDEQMPEESKTNALHKDGMEY